MSAYVVSKHHIDAIVTAWVALGIRHRDSRSRSEDADKVGAMLWHENLESVRYRYGYADPDLPGATVEEYTWTRVRMPDGEWSVVIARILKLLDCYAYQSCEHPGWAESQAAKLVGAMRQEAWTLLPAYAEADWVATGPDVFTRP